MYDVCSVAQVRDNKIQNSCVVDKKTDLQPLNSEPRHIFMLVCLNGNYVYDEKKCKPF